MSFFPIIITLQRAAEGDTLSRRVQYLRTGVWEALAGVQGQRIYIARTV